MLPWKENRFSKISYKDKTNLEKMIYKLYTDLTQNNDIDTNTMNIDYSSESQKLESLRKQEHLCQTGSVQFHSSSSGIDYTSNEGYYGLREQLDSIINEPDYIECKDSIQIIINIINNLDEMQNILDNYFKYKITNIIDRDTGQQYSAHINKIVGIDILRKGRELEITSISGEKIKSGKVTHVTTQYGKILITTEGRIWNLEYVKEKEGEYANYL